MLSSLRLTRARSAHYHAFMNSTAQRNGSGSTLRRLTSILCTTFAAACGGATEPVVLAWEAELDPSGPGGVSGSAAMVSQYGRTDMSIQIQSSAAGATYQWRINEGGCGAPGALVGGAAIYPPLTVQAASSASADANMGGMLDQDRTYAARVFGTSVGGGEVLVACGEMARVR